MPTICTYPTTDRLNLLVHHKKQKNKEGESTDSWSQLSIPATTFFSGECLILVCLLLYVENIPILQYVGSNQIGN